MKDTVRKTKISLNEPVVFRSRIEWGFHLLSLSGGLLFTGIGFAMIRSGTVAGWFVTGFFGLLPCLFLLRLFPNCAFVRISSKGIELRDWFRSVLFRWEQLASFEYRETEAGEYVNCVLADGADDDECFELPPVYGAEPFTLVNLLNDWQAAVIEARTN